MKCMCGHAANAHTFLNGGRCSFCPCFRLRVVPPTTEEQKFDKECAVIMALHAARPASELVQ